MGLERPWIQTCRKYNGAYAELIRIAPQAFLVLNPPQGLAGSLVGDAWSWSRKVHKSGFVSSEWTSQDAMLSFQ